MRSISAGGGTAAALPAAPFPAGGRPLEGTGPAAAAPPLLGTAGRARPASGHPGPPLPRLGLDSSAQRGREEAVEGLMGRQKGEAEGNQIPTGVLQRCRQHNCATAEPTTDATMACENIQIIGAYATHKRAGTTRCPTSARLLRWVLE